MPFFVYTIRRQRRAYYAAMDGKSGRAVLSSHIMLVIPNLELAEKIRFQLEVLDRKEGWFVGEYKQRKRKTPPNLADV